jgi:hypothetical protein
MSGFPSVADTGAPFKVAAASGLPATAAVRLAPRSDPTDGVLALFIRATTGGPSPKIPPVVQQPLISQDHITSLIFSPSFIGRAYVVPGLSAYSVAPPTMTATYIATSSTTVTTKRRLSHTVFDAQELLRKRR